MHPGGLVGWIIRTIQFVFDVIILAMAAALVANQPSGGSPSQINYAVFVGVISLLTWFYTVGASSFQPEGLGSPIIILILDSLNCLFAFCGGIAIAVALRVHSCGDTAYIITNEITAGSTQRCHEAQTLTAFLWFAFAAYLASIITIAIFSSVEVKRYRKNGGGVVPQMTSVGV